MYDILMLGHVSKDIIEDPHGVQHVLGGPVVYCSAAAARSGASVLVVTKAATGDRERLSIITESGAELRTLDTTATTSIHNRYHDADHERRTVTLLQAADPFTIDDIPADEARIIHFAGLFAGDLPEELVERLAPRGEIALDAQGVVRKNEAGDLVSGDWKRKERFLPSITYFKTDAAEAEALTGLSDREKAAGRLVEMGAREVMLTYHSEVLLAAPGELHRAPLTPRNLSGRTGRGDTCFAAYLARRLSHDREESLRYAAALVSIKLETPGVFRGTPEDVIARIT